MNQPPQRVPMSKPSPDTKPGPAPVQPGGPQPVHGQPPQKSGGSSVLLIVLGIFGGGGLLLFLLCAGGIWWAVSSAGRAAREMEQDVRAAQREIEKQAHKNQQNFQPPPIGGIHSVADAAGAMDDRSLARGMQALAYLANNPVDEAHREEVVRKALPLLSDFHRRGLARQVLEKYATADEATTLVAAAQSLDGHRGGDARNTIIEVLAKLDTPEAAPLVAEYHMARGNAAAARTAYSSLGEDGASHLAVLLNDPDANKRNTARQLLSEMKVDDKLLARQALVDLQSGQRDRQREAARWLAGHVVVDETLSPQVAAALAGLLNDRYLRSEASAALAFWAISETVPALINAAAEAHAANDRQAEKEIVAALAKLNDARAAPTYAAFLDTRYDRNLAQSAFSGIGSDAAPALLPFVNHSDSSVRQMARELLKEWEVDPQQIAAQTRIDLESGDRNRQREAIRQLAVADEPDPAIQSQIAASLITLLDDANLRYEVFRALGKWATSENVPKLLVLLEHEDQNVRGEAAKVLVALKDPRAVDALAEGLGGGDFFKRSNATRYVRELGPVAETAVWPHVTNDDWQIAKNAVEILRDIGTKRSLPLLEAAKTHNSSFVRSEAERAITAVTEAKREVPEAVAAASEESGNGTRQMRTWTDASGKNKIEALLIEFAQGKVRLRMRTGRTLSLDLNQLSDEDRKYVLSQVK